MAKIFWLSVPDPGKNKSAVSRVLSWVPVERKRTDASLIGAVVSLAAEDVVFAVAPGPEGLTPCLFSSRRRANRSITMFVIVALAGLFQFPPRLSRYCANSGTVVKSNIKIKKQQRLNRDAFSFILLISCLIRTNLWFRPVLSYQTNATSLSRTCHPTIGTPSVSPFHNNAQTI
jgi:hypothetical protein